MRRNVLAWLTEQVREQARHAVILTHNIDFLFVQGVLERHLRRAGNPRLTIFADAGCAASSWRRDRRLLDGLGIRYRVVPVELGPYRRFHPKALLLANRERAALAVGSGNLTHGGMSANHEAWTFGVSDGDGAALLLAFHDYMAGLLGDLPLSEPLRAALDDVFDPQQAWVGGLPPPGGLLGSPSPRPLIDQLSEAVRGPVRAVSVIAPYHDDDGAGLRALAERFSGPVTCWVQPGHEGLSQTAAAGLPASVTLKSMRMPGTHQAFIHAKIFAFHRDEDLTLALGSANCSRAALLSDGGWGNAELVALEDVSPAVWSELISELELSDLPPSLPEHPPSDEWDEPSTESVVILAARQSAGLLQIAFRSTAPTTALTVESDEASWSVSLEDAAAGLVRLAAPVSVKVVRLKALLADGARIVSADAWVDDEGALGQPATLKRLADRLAAARPEGEPSIEDYIGILDYFGDYIRDPEARRREIGGRQAEEGGPPTRYDPALVFSDAFGPATVLPSGRGFGRQEGATDILAMLRALFPLNPSLSPAAPPDSEEPAEPDLDPETEAGEAEEVPVRRPPPPSDDRARRRLQATLTVLEQVLSEDDFVQSRTPALLAHDLGMCAALLLKGLAEGTLEPEVFRAITRRIWAALFYGPSGAMNGSLNRRLGQLVEGAERDGFITALASRELSAALTLWACPEWLATDAEGAIFRLSAIELAERSPWLFAGDEPPGVLAQMGVLGEALRLSANDWTAARLAWTDLLRRSFALAALRDALAASAARLQDLATRPTIGPLDLIWANKQFGFVTSPAHRGPRDKASVRFAGEVQPRQFMALSLIPVEDVVEGGGLGLSPEALPQVRRLIESFRGALVAG